MSVARHAPARVPLEGLIIEDERSLRQVGLYADLKRVLERARYRFRVLSPGPSARWDRALVLNLTFWGAAADGDVLVDRRLAADVVAHAAWHHLAARALLSGRPPALSADALFFGEAIASAFDVYLVGMLLRHAPRSPFLSTQVPSMAEAASAAGLPAVGFRALLERIAAAPEPSFESLRQLLFDAATRLCAAGGVTRACSILARLDEHPFAPLLHHYELSNWVLYARAYAPAALAPDPRVRALDRALRAAPSSLEWLAREWIAPSLRERRKSAPPDG